ncbi:MAG: hypothetical protein OXT73_10275 [Bacteroidota bacterium]|nr:hypothetical protein [Bacteroidota bacterium]
MLSTFDTAAQGRPDPGALLLEGGFERDVNRYRWTANVASRTRVGPWEVDVLNRYRSDAFLLFDDRLSFRDENRTRFSASTASGTDDPGAVIFGGADWFSLSRVFRQEVWGGYRFWPESRVWIEPAVGLSVDARPGFGASAQSAPVRTDAGPSFGVRMGVPMTDLGGYLTQVHGVAQVQRMAPRTGRVLRSLLDAERTFNRVRLRTRLAGSSVRRDAYQAASFLNRDDAVGREAETVESTRSDTMAVGLDVESQLATPLFLTVSLDVGANARQVETLRAPADALFFDSEFRRRTVEATVATRWEEARTRARLALTAGAEVERRRLTNADDLPPAQAAQKLNLLRQADNERGYLSLQGTLDSEVRSGWSVHLDASANILRHDTPDVNPDDRDELFYNAVIGSRIKIRDGLELTAQVFGSWFHTVYIKAARSAENSIQRSIRYRPGVNWRPGPRTRVRLSSEVRATYTVDDFILAGRRPTDQAAREMRYELDAEHQVRSGLRLMLTGSVSDLQLGRFLEDVFAEIPFDTLRTVSFWGRVQTGRRVQAEIGVRAFIRTDFDRAASVRYVIPESGEESRIARTGRQRIDQIGPTMAIVWPMRRNAYLRLDGWATVQTISHRLYGGLPEGREDLIRSAAAKGQRSLIPNLALTMRWGL